MRRVLAPYLFAFVPFIATVLAQGTAVLGLDRHPLQRYEALLMLAFAVMMFRISELAPFERVLYSAGVVWLAIDETLMVHECAKWKWKLARTVSDPIVLAYGVAAALAFVRIARLPPARLHGAIALFGAVLAAGVDQIHGSSHTALGLVLEEGGEFLAIAAAIAMARAATRAPSPPAPAVGFVAFNAAWMGACIWMLRPWFCPARLL